MKANQKGYLSVYQPQALVYHRTSKGHLTPQYFEKMAFYQGVCNSFTTIGREHRNSCGNLRKHKPPELLNWAIEDDYWDY